MLSELLDGDWCVEPRCGFAAAHDGKPLAYRERRLWFPAPRLCLGAQRRSLLSFHSPPTMRQSLIARAAA